MTTTLIPVLGDQLSHNLASLRGIDKADAVVLMMEVAEERPSCSSVASLPKSRARVCS